MPVELRKGVSGCWPPDRLANLCSSVAAILKIQPVRSTEIFKDCVILDPMSDSIERLFDDVLAEQRGDPSLSRTARLLQAGRTKIAKKVAEEATEVVMEAIGGDRAAVVRESADLIYNLVVLWATAGVNPKDVWKEMNRREQLFGMAEKLLKRQAAPKARRKVAALAVHRMEKRRSA